MGSKFVKKIPFHYIYHFYKQILNDHMSNSPLSSHYSHSYHLLPFIHHSDLPISYSLLLLSNSIFSFFAYQGPFVSFSFSTPPCFHLSYLHHHYHFSFPIILSFSQQVVLHEIFTNALTFHLCCHLVHYMSSSMLNILQNEFIGCIKRAATREIFLSIFY